MTATALAEVSDCVPTGLEVLGVVRERARAAEIGLHLLDRGQPMVRRLLTDAGLD